MSVSKESRKVSTTEMATRTAVTANTVRYRRLEKRAKRCRGESAIQILGIKGGGRSANRPAEEEPAEAHEVFDTGVDRDHQRRPEGERGQTREQRLDLVVDDQQGDRHDLDDRLELAREPRRNHQVL